LSGTTNSLSSSGSWLTSLAVMVVTNALLNGPFIWRSEPLMVMLVRTTSGKPLILANLAASGFAPAPRVLPRVRTSP
jgi:hypothetical protein